MKKSSVRFKTKLPKYLGISVFLAALISSSVSADDLKDAKRAIRVRQYDVAYHLYLNAANTGNAEAQYQLANLYASGNGVKADEKKAFSWLETAAKQEHPAALYSLAVKLERKDQARAQKLMQKSAALNYQPATRYLEKAQFSVQSKSTNKKSQVDIWFGSAQNNDVVKMQRLLGRGITVDQQDNAGRTALFAAIESNSVDVVSWLLNKGISPNHRDKFGASAAFVAIDENRMELLQLLFANGLSAKQALTNGDNLLHYAVRRERYRFVPFLLNKKVPINRVNDDGWTPLDLAHYAKANKTIARLESKGATRGANWNNDLATNTGEDGSTSRLLNLAKENKIDLAELGQVVISGNTEILKQIIDSQKNFTSKVNQKLDDGSTLISLAAKAGHADIVRMLLAAGSFPSIPTFSGVRPLHIAAREGHDKIIEQLLDAGADPLKRDDQNRDAIHWAIQARQQSSSILLVDRLLASKSGSTKKAQFDNYILMASQYKLDPLVIKLGPYASNAASDDIGRNALWFASQNKNAAIIPQLLSYGIPPNVADHEGKTPFYVAVSSDCLACAQQLISYTNVNQQIITGNSPLIAAAENKNSLIVEWLLTQGADTELTNELRNTALISAVEADASDIVRLLIDAGANISRKNNFGFSALDIAKKSNQEIYDYLKRRSLLGAF